MKNILIILICLFLAGCDPEVTSGKISKKIFTPHHVENREVLQNIWYNGDVPTFIYETVDVDVPDCWELELENEINGKIIKRRIVVTKDTYNSFHESDWFDLLIR